MEENAVFIGIDLGTSAVKLLLMTEDGKIRKIVSEEYPLSMPKPGWSEQNPQDWENAAISGLKKLLEGEKAENVKGIGIGGQMHGLVALDAQDAVVRPAILWNDGRTEEETAWLNESVGTETLAKLSGNIAFAGFTAPKLLWMRKHEPERFERIAKIMLPKDYLVYRLTGVHATDCSDASGMLLFDVEHRNWSKELTALCGLVPTQLAGVYESYEPVGTLTKRAAEAVGLSEKVIVVAGAGDNAAAAVGTGTVGEGGCNISLGTSGTVFISGGQFVNPANHAIHSFCHADGGWHLMGVELSSASCNQWWADILGNRNFAAQQAEIDENRLGVNPVLWLPYLMGERTPHNDASARAAFWGMSMDSTRADMTQAVLEGVAFGLKDALEGAKSAGVKVEVSRLCGGGAKSALWSKIIANVLGIRLEMLKTEQGPGLGGAMLAAVGCGAYQTVSEAADAIVEVSGSIVPERELTERYALRYAEWKKLYPALRSVYAEK